MSVESDKKKKKKVTLAMKLEITKQFDKFQSQTTSGIMISLSEFTLQLNLSKTRTR